MLKISDFKKGDVFKHWALKTASIVITSRCGYNGLSMEFYGTLNTGEKRPVYNNRSTWRDTPSENTKLL